GRIFAGVGCDGESLGRRFGSFLEGECGPCPDQQGSNYAGRKRNSAHDPLSADRMSAGLHDFKLDASAVKPLLKLDNLRRLSLSVSTQPQIEDAQGPVAQRKKRPPRRAVSRSVLQRGPGLEVEAPARVEHVEIVDRFADALEFAVGRNREVTRDEIEVGGEVLVRGVEMEGRRLKTLVDREEPPIDLGAGD